MKIFRTGWLLAGFLLLLAVVIAGSVYALRRDRLADEERQLGNLAAISADILERRMLHVDHLLRQMIGRAPAWRTADPSGQMLRERMTELAILSDGSAALRLFSPTGEIIASSGRMPRGRSFPIAPYFAAAKAAANGDLQVIAQPVEAAGEGVPFVLTRKFYQPNGEFAGVGMAIMDMALIAGILNRYASDTKIALIYGDGRLIVAVPEDAQIENDLAAPGTPLARHLDRSDLASFFADDGHGQMVALKTVQVTDANQGQPLVLALERDRMVILADWQQQAWGWGLLYLLLVTLSGGGLWWHQKKQGEYWQNILRKQALVNASADGILVLDSEGLLVDANPAFLATLGLTPEALGKIRVDAFDSKMSLATIVGELGRIRETGQSLRVETQHRHQDGHLIDVEVTCNYLELNGKDLFVASIRDIGERKQLIEQLAQRELELKTIIDTEPECLKLLSPEGKLLSMNSAGLAMLEADSLEQMREHSMMDIVLPPYREAFMDLFQRVFAGGAGTLEFKISTLCGNLRWMETHAVPMRDTSGRITALLGLTRDVTEKKRMQEELRAHNEHLEELVANKTAELRAANVSLAAANEAAMLAAQSKAAFLSNMSHEIRTPLNGIIGMLHLLHRTGIDERQSDYLGKIGFSARHLLSLVNDILDLSKIDAGKMQLEQLPVNIPMIVANICSIIGESARKKGLTLITDLSPDFPAGLLGDTTRLTQILLNYASNAVKFTEAGSITIRACRLASGAVDTSGVDVRFEVEDTGVGIDPEAIERIFLAFEQADNSTTRQYQGTGLGLTISRQLARLMGGDAGAASAPGQGSCFWFTARLALGGGREAIAEAQGGGDAESRVLALHAGKRVLLVEDEPINQEISQMLLADAGLAVDLANNGEEAVAKAASGDYTLILMDMQMPVMDGLEATRRIRQLANGKTVPIIAMTANAFADDRERCFKAGMNDFVAKPVDPETLFGRILVCLGGA
ncbi:MAG: response regulator [Azonexus sp.]|jgi:PAS domain S-box-containing protein|nr:response regulator [Azonexus sp.]